jgi:pseudouridine synthase
LGRPSPGKILQLEQGILLEGKKTSPAKLQILTRKTSTTSIRITIHEGRKRQVKKMFQAIGHPLFHLKRVAYGNLFLEGLLPGKFQLLNDEDLKKIFLKKIPLQKNK